MKQLYVELNNASRRADKSISLKFETMTSIPSEELGEIDSYIGNIALVVLTDQTNPDNLGFDVTKIIKENATDLDISKSKSHSERLRNVLYLYCQKLAGKKITEEEFAKFYAEMMEKIIQVYKDKLD